MCEAVGENATGGLHLFKNVSDDVSIS